MQFLHEDICMRCINVNSTWTELELISQPTGMRGICPCSKSGLTGEFSSLRKLFHTLNTNMQYFPKEKENNHKLCFQLI